MKSNYSQKLLDPRWQKKRLEILNRDEWICRDCGEDSKALHVHHRIYIPGKQPWEIDDDLLITLCADCHEFEGNEMPSSIQLLTTAVKSKFLSGHIKDIAEGFNALDPMFGNEIFATVIKHWLSNPEKAREMYNKFFEYLR